MAKVRFVTAGSSGNADDYYEFAETAGIEDFQEIEGQVVGEVWDPATGAVDPVAVNKARALILARTKNPEMKSILAQIQRRVERTIGLLMERSSEMGIVSVVPLNFEQNGPGVPIVTQTWNPPRGLPAFYLGWGTRASTVETIGVVQWSYATIPLVTPESVTSPYAGVLGGQRWMTLATASTQYKCSPRACHPRLMAGSVHLPASPMSMSLIQTATIGLEASPGINHGIDIYYAQKMVCNPNQDFKLLMRQWGDDVSDMRRQFGPYLAPR